MFGHTVNPISSPLVIVANPKRCVLESGGGIVAVKAAVRIVALGNTHSLGSNTIEITFWLSCDSFYTFYLVDSFNAPSKWSPNICCRKDILG